MNRVILLGRLTKDPEVRYTADGMAIARYTLAVDRVSKDKDKGADFISCVAFGKGGEFAEKFLAKGIKIAIEGHIQTGSYEKDGVKHYTTDVIVDRHEFCESKGGFEKSNQGDNQDDTPPEGFQQIDEDDMPF